ncbi:hypothetical protein [Laspinema palackyanum]|uniref:hypothetical protein n=1 Tax=Laspinema palackyanum TaxID=3231601 RepID=UPI00345CE835
MRCQDFSQTVPGRSPEGITRENPPNPDSVQTGNCTGTRGCHLSPFQVRSHLKENSLTTKKSVELPTSTQPTHPDKTPKPRA